MVLTIHISIYILYPGNNSQLAKANIQNQWTFKMSFKYLRTLFISTNGTLCYQADDEYEL